MLTVDDANTILEKYKAGYWVEIDLNQFEIAKDKTYEVDGFKLEFLENLNHKIYCKLTIFNNSWKHQIYFRNSIGEYGVTYISSAGSDYYNFMLPDDYDVIIGLYISNVDNDYNIRPDLFHRFMIYPLSNLIIPVINGEFDDKFYIIPVGVEAPQKYQINGEIVELEEDEKGTFLRLPSAEDCMIGIAITEDNIPMNMYKIFFRKFKELPIPYIPTLYKGTPQSIQVLNTEDDDPISDYQTYYQGRQLKDNTIHLPYDADDYINIIVDLKDYRYPFCTVKLKAPTTIYQADSQSDVETAIENGIQTFQVGDNQNEVTLNSITLSNVTLINSNIQVSESILTDCQIIDSAYTDNGGNNITNTIFKDTDYTTTAQSNYNEVTFNECDIHDSEINLTGTITDSTITDTLIISDGTINIQDNTFTGVGAKEYFPSHLYLTGDYTVTGNTFNLTGEWEELEYNMCLIKTTNDFNPSKFINENTFNLNITYEDEPTNTFYYNIVDDDKIRAVRL